MAMVLGIEIERDAESLWVGVVPSLPEALVYAVSEDQARARVRALALRLIADRLERGELGATLRELTFVETRGPAPQGRAPSSFRRASERSNAWTQ